MTLCAINLNRGRSKYDNEYTRLCRRFPRLQISPQNCWAASVLVPAYTNAATKGIKQVPLPDGALMVRLTSGYPFTNGLGALGWSFNKTAANTAQMTADVLDSNAYALYGNEARKLGAKENINAGWFYCRGRKEIYLYNGETGGRRVGIEVYIGE